MAVEFSNAGNDSNLKSFLTLVDLSRFNVELVMELMQVYCNKLDF